MLASLDNDLVASEEEMTRHWAAHAAGDFELFPRLFVSHDDALLEGSFGRIRADGSYFFGTPFRASMSGEYMRSFRRLLKLARDCDSGGTILGTVTQTPHGLVYGAMWSQLQAPAAWLLLDDSEALAGPPAEVAGTWFMVFDEADAPGEPESKLRLCVGDEGLVGSVTSVRGEASVEAGAVTGSALFSRLSVSDTMMFCATVDGDRMRGRGEDQSGGTYRFTATRHDEA